jgi:hypothetical protein
MWAPETQAAKKKKKKKWAWAKAREEERINAPVGDVFLPPLLSSQGIALISPPSAQVWVIRDTTSGFLHPPGQRGHTQTHTRICIVATEHSRKALPSPSPNLNGGVPLRSWLLWPPTGGHNSHLKSRSSSPSPAFRWLAWPIVCTSRSPETELASWVTLRCLLPRNRESSLNSFYPKYLGPEVFPPFLSSSDFKIFA